MVNNISINLNNNEDITVDYNRESGEVKIDSGTLEKMKSLDTLSKLRSSLETVDQILTQGGLNAKVSASTDETAKKIIGYIQENSKDKDKALSFIKDKLHVKNSKLEEIKTSIHKIQKDVFYKEVALKQNAAFDALTQNKKLVIAITTKSEDTMASGSIGQDVYRFLSQEECEFSFIPNANTKEVFKDVSHKSSDVSDIAERTKNMIYNLFVVAHGPNFEKQPILLPRYQRFIEKMNNTTDVNDIGKHVEELMNGLLSSQNPKNEMIVKLLYTILSQHVRNEFSEVLKNGKEGALLSELKVPPYNAKFIPQKVKIDLSQKDTIQVTRDINIPFEARPMHFYGVMNLKFNKEGRCTEGSLTKTIKMNEKTDIKDADIAYAKELVKNIQEQGKQHHVDFDIQLELPRARPKLANVASHIMPNQ